MQSGDQVDGTKENERGPRPAASKRVPDLTDRVADEMELVRRWTSAPPLPAEGSFLRK